MKIELENSDLQSMLEQYLSTTFTVSTSINAFKVVAGRNSNESRIELDVTLGSKATTVNLCCKTDKITNTQEVVVQDEIVAEEEEIVPAEEVELVKEPVVIPDEPKHQSDIQLSSKPSEETTPLSFFNRPQ